MSKQSITEQMDWILKNTKNLEFHTNLTKLLEPIFKDLPNCNWLLSDLDFMAHEEIPIVFGNDFYILGHADFERLLRARVQIIWGVISAIPNGDTIFVDNANLPYVEGNEEVWTNGNLQVPNSLLEIYAFDSSYSIVKFTDGRHSEKFREHFPEAIELEKFK